jgi:hypothetical protein
MQKHRATTSKVIRLDMRVLPHRATLRNKV